MSPQADCAEQIADLNQMVKKLKIQLELQKDPKRHLWITGRRVIIIQNPSTSRRAVAYFTPGILQKHH